MNNENTILKIPHEQAVDVLARTIWGEARGQGEAGMRAVAHVVMNRVRLSRNLKNAWWGQDVVAVCRKPYQFSCWNLGDPNRAKLTAVDLRNLDFRQACRIAESVLRGADSFDPTGGATHYHRFDCAPRWSRDETVITRIGDHVFFDLAGKRK